MLRHCEERSDEAILYLTTLRRIATPFGLAMTSVLISLFDESTDAQRNGQLGEHFCNSRREALLLLP